MTRRYWLSWEEPGDDPRPVAVPPPDGVVGWWWTGQGDGYSTICAVVDAVDAKGARAVVESPGGWRPRAWRFCDMKDDANWMPSPDRFPPKGRA